MFGSAFQQSWFKSVRPIGDPLTGDAVEQLMIEQHSMNCASMLLVIDQPLKLFEELKRPLEANRSWLNLMFRCCLRHDHTDEIVSENVRPNLLTHEFRCFATQDIHLQSLFHRTQVKLGIPTRSIEFTNFLFGKLLGIEKRRDHNDCLGLKASFLDANTTFTNGEIFGQHFLSLPTERSNHRSLPADDVIFFSETLSFSKVGLSHRLQLRDGVDPSLLERP